MQSDDDAPRAGLGSPARFSRAEVQTIEGEQKAREYIARLQAQQVDPDELAVIVSMMYGAALRGFCKVLTRAIGEAI